MRVYIATGFAKAKALAIPAAERLEKAGIGITCKWWEPTPCPECGGNGTGPDRIDGDGDVYQSECGTCDGTGLPPPVPETELPIEEQRKTALIDLQGVRDADIVWVMSPGPSRPSGLESGSIWVPGTGCWVEMGYALALGKTIVYSGFPRTIFTSLLARQFLGNGGHDQAFEWIVVQSGRVSSESEQRFGLPPKSVYVNPRPSER